MAKLRGLGNKHLTFMEQHMSAIAGIDLSEAYRAAAVKWMSDFRASNDYPGFTRLVIDFEDGAGRQYLPGKYNEVWDHDWYVEMAEDGGQALAWYQANCTDCPRAVYVRIPDLESAPAEAVAVIETFLRAYYDAGGSTELELGITVPKVRHENHGYGIEMVLSRLESEIEDLEAGSIPVEVIVEASAGMRDVNGCLMVHKIAKKMQNRLRHVAIGAYDFLYDLGVPYPTLSPTHQLMDHARMDLIMTFSGTTISINNGPITKVPSLTKDGEEVVVDDSWVKNMTYCYDFMADIFDVGQPRAWVLAPGSDLAYLLALYIQHRKTLDYVELFAAMLVSFGETRNVSANIEGEFLDRASSGPLWNSLCQAYNWGMMGEEHIAALPIIVKCAGMSFDEMLATQDG